MERKRLVYIAGTSGDKSIGSYIREDIRNIKSILEVYENQGQIILRIDEWVRKEDAIARFRSSGILPWLFYFSGHSNGTQISLSDGNIPAEIFAKLFINSRTREALQLVYLGSCNSLAIGRKLIANKVKVVIVSDRNVRPDFANIVSRLFFYRLFISKNIQEAFDATCADYEFDRSTFNVNEHIDFPWQLLASNNSYLTKSFKQIRLTVQQKSQLVMNAASIRLDLLSYYMENNELSSIQTELIKEEASSIKNTLDKTIKEVETDQDMGTLFDLWKENRLQNFLPHNHRILKIPKSINHNNLQDDFMIQIKENARNMINVSDNIIKR